MLSADVTPEDGWFVGEDKALAFTVYPEGAVLSPKDGLVYTDSDFTTLAVPHDITGWTLSYALRASEDAAGDPLVEKTSPVGIDVVDPVNGLVLVDIDRADTQDLEPGTYFHSLARTDPGQWTVVAAGDAVLRHAATR